MKVYPNIFSNNPVDRVSDLRSDPSWVEKTLNSEKTMICLFWRGKAFISKHKSIILDKSLIANYPSCCSGHGFWRNNDTSKKVLNEIIRRYVLRVRTRLY